MGYGMEENQKDEMNCMKLLAFVYSSRFGHDMLFNVS
jgi:hypothetical protein